MAGFKNRLHLKFVTSRLSCISLSIVLHQYSSFLLCILCVFAAINSSSRLSRNKLHFKNLCQFAPSLSIFVFFVFSAVNFVSRLSRFFLSLNPICDYPRHLPLKTCLCIFAASYCILKICVNSRQFASSLSVFVFFVFSAANFVSRLSRLFSVFESHLRLSASSAVKNVFSVLRILRIFAAIILFSCLSFRR